MTEAELDDIKYFAFQASVSLESGDIEKAKVKLKRLMTLIDAMKTAS